MSFTNQTQKSGPYSCDGSTVDFTGSFYCIDPTHISVVLTDANGTDTTLTVTTHYTVTTAAASFPTSSFNVQTVSTYASGNKITILRNTPKTQESDFGNSGPYLPNTHETAFDKNMAAIQELAEVVDRCVKDSPSVTSTTDPTTYLTACQAAQAAAVAAAASATAASDNFFVVEYLQDSNIDLKTALVNGATVDGSTVSTGDRVWVWGQTSVGEAGIYIVAASGAASRASDFPVGMSTAGKIISVQSGTTYGDTAWQITAAPGSDVVGTHGQPKHQVLTEPTANDTHLVRRSGLIAEESLTSFAATILDDANAAAVRSTLGLGDSAVSSVDDSSIEVSGGTLQVKAGGITNAMLADPKIKAWVKFDGTAGTVAATDSYNVASIDDVGTGEYRVNLSVAVGATACALVSGKTVDDESTDGWEGIMVRQSSTTAFYIAAGTLTPADLAVVYLAVFE